MSTLAISTRSKVFDQFRNALRRKIDELGLDQGEAAERVGMQRTDLCALLNGRHPPSMATIEKIAEGLNVEIEISIN